MALALRTPPAAVPVTIDEAKRALRIDGTDHDDLLAALLAAATGYVDGADGFIGRALVSQDWTLSLDRFPCGVVKLPLPPLQAVSAIRTVDGDGVQRTLDAAAYQVDTVSQPGRLAPAPGTVWPQTRAQLGAVEIDFTAGYGAAAAVPAPLKQAIIALVAHWHAVPEAVNLGDTVTEVPFAVGALLAPYKVWSWM